MKLPLDVLDPGKVNLGIHLQGIQEAKLIQTSYVQIILINIL